MSNSLRPLRLLALAIASALTLSACGGEATSATSASSAASEALPAAMQQAIRDEGLERSQAMTYVAQLADGIGPRLVGTPGMTQANAWALKTMAGIGLSDPRLEPIGMDTVGWIHHGSSVRMHAPNAMDFLAHAGAWSVATPGLVDAEAVAVSLQDDAALAAAKGSLRGKIVLLGPLRETPPVTGPMTQRYSDEDVLSGAPNADVRASYKNVAERRTQQAEAGLFKARLRAFLDAEQVAAVLVPSRDAPHGGGSGSLTVDEGPFSVRSWSPAERATFPFAYVAIEHFGRAWRLAQAGQPVRLQVRIDTEESKALQPAYNVVADWPGSDPALAPQVVLAGAHLDSWIAGTGALDNASGVATVLEAVRILKQAGFTPKRTIRVALFAAEEQGLYGSMAYAKQHLGAYPRATGEDQLALTAEGWRQATGPLQTKPDYDQFSIMYNMDFGAGRIRGVYAGGNPQLAAHFKAWIKPLKDLGVLAVYDEPFWPSDQASFSDIGLPGVMFLQDPLEYFTRARHSNLDTLERVPPEDIAQASTVLAFFIANSAIAPTLMPRAAINP